jgi:hypothetical protein
MTTFTLVDHEVDVHVNGQTANFQEKTVYTVPTGKVARVQLDSINVYADGGAGEIIHMTIMYWSKPNNTLKKFYTASYNSDNSATQYVRTISWYPNWTQPDPSNFSSGAANYFSYSMNAQMEDWVDSNGNFSNDKDAYAGMADAQQSVNRGTRLWAPKQSFLKAGETIKFNGQAYRSTNNNYLWVNTRLAVFLEDE